MPKMERFNLSGKRALVTGASRGIGLVCAQALAEAGADTTLVARNEASLRHHAEALRQSGHTASAHSLDLVDFGAVRSFFETATPAFDILVNNAGMARHTAFLEVTEAQFDAVLELNLKAVFFASQAFAARLVAEGRPGVIITMSSQMGHVGGLNRSVYCASKFGVEGLTKALAADLGPKGIRVNTICPTFIETELTRDSLQEPGFASYILDRIPLGRFGTLEEVAGAVVFLASEAASLMTGSALMLDGGWTAL